MIRTCCWLSRCRWESTRFGSASSRSASRLRPPRRLSAVAAPAAAPAAASAAAAVDREALNQETSRVDAGLSKLSVHPKGAAVVSASYKGPLGSVELVSDPQPGLFATFPELSFKEEAPGRYWARHPEGLKIVKEFLPGGGDLLPRIRVTVSNTSGKSVEAGGWMLSIGPGLGTVASELDENASLTRAIALTTPKDGGNGKVEVLKPGEHAGSYRWVGVDNRYFLAAVVAPEGFKTSSLAPIPTLQLRAPSTELAPKAQAVWEFPYYVGAKATSELLRHKIGLERSPSISDSSPSWAAWSWSRSTSSTPSPATGAGPSSS